ncbi:LOW QUALITY PROTEIN: putative uncharacterized protein DDB_G0277255, partial [Panonychus citri]|uniref:LOW QUALITY PROTEIN: putative uncharacterized protein DDB_G0277255 n=1 Tax=Panonychus citri TaxID=50023 RepID=UPI002307BF78
IILYQFSYNNVNNHFLFFSIQTELSHQGDDFTKQMWDMYATFEDMISGSGQRDERARTTLLELSSTSSSSSLNTHLGGVGKNVIDSTLVGTNSLSSNCSIVNQEVDSLISSSDISSSANGSPDSVSDENEISMIKAETISTQIVEKNSVPSNELDSQLESTSIILPDESSIKSVDSNNNNGTVSTDKTNCHQRFRPIPTGKGKLLPTRQSTVDKLVDKSVAPTTINLGYQSDSGSNSSLANPLLDTISCLTSSDPYSDSDDYDVTRNKVINQRARRRCRRMLSDRSIRCSPNHLHSCCSSDADSIGYAGSNSIDSGYKSLCPTPEVPESISNLLPYKVPELKIDDKVNSTAKIAECNSLVSSNSSSSLSAFQRLGGFNSRNSSNFPYINSPSSSTISSVSMKFRDNPQIQTLNRDHPIPSSSSSSSISGSYGSRGVNVSSRLKSQTTEAHLEHLLTLRQSLISAIQKCESSSTSTPTDSRVASPVISSRSTSPASTVIPRTVSNLKITPSTPTGGTSYSPSSSSILSSTTFESNQMLQQSSIHRTGCSSPQTATTITSNGPTGKHLSSSLSPEPWYSQHHYSPSPSHHQHHQYNYYSQSQYSATVNPSRFTRTINNPQISISDHQSPKPMTSSSSLSIDCDLITPTQSSDILNEYKDQQNYSSSTSATFNNNTNGKSVRFEEVKLTPLTNYSPLNSLIMSLDCSTIDSNDYPDELNPLQQSKERSTSSMRSNSSVSSIVTSGLETGIVDCINDTGSNNSTNSNSLNSNCNSTINSNSNTDFTNNNVNGNGNNIDANNGINYNISSSSSSSSSVKSSTGTFSTKSILKDPICANLRTAIESGQFNAAQSIENEIDSLLYGKHFNDSMSQLTNHRENITIESQYLPASKEIPTDLYHKSQSTIDDPLDIPYVKMIEEKYRTTNIRTKLKDHDDTFTSHFSDKINGKSNDIIDPTRTVDDVNVTMNYQRKSPSSYLVNHQGANHFESQHVSIYHHDNHSHYQKEHQLRNCSSKDLVDSRLDSMSKSKISEMAKCMLGILDEIEMKNSIENRLPKLETGSVRLREKVNYSKDRPRPSSAEFRGSLEFNSVVMNRNNMENESESSYNSLPEYHIYEEVAYDYMMRGEHPIRSASPSSSIVTNQRKERPPGRRILPPNPSGSTSMLTNLRFSGNPRGSSSIYRSSLKDLFTKSSDGNNNDNHLSRTAGRYETELKCFRSSSSSPLSRISTTTNNNQISSSTINKPNGQSTRRSWSRVTEQPKQRGNLYSLFTDPNQRINIGRSLRKDYNYNHSSTINHLQIYNQMDQFSSSSTSSEYGFKNN